MLMKSALVLLTILSVNIAFAKVEEIPADFSAIGRQCHDGDTCIVTVEGKDLKIRLGGIDAPELAQKMGPQAQAFTASFVVGKKIDLECQSLSFERIVCTVFQAGRNINSEIVRYGWAFDFPQFSHGQYRSLEDNARKQRLGVWTDEKNCAVPFCFRHPNSRECQFDRLFMP